MASPRKKTAAELHQQRVWRLAIVLGVVFIAVAAIQGPKLVSLLSGSSTPAAAPPPPLSSSPTEAMQATAGASAVPTAAPPVNSSLTKFSLFAWTDPFRVQPQPSSASSTAGEAAGGTSSGSTKGTAASTSGGSTTSSASSSASTPSATQQPSPRTTGASVTGSSKSGLAGQSSPSSSAPQSSTATTSGLGANGSKTRGSSPSLPAIQFGPVAPSALVTVDGLRQVVSVGGFFPAVEPIFELDSIGSSTVRISVPGGLFASGAKTVSLHVGRPVTLAYQLLGVDYVVEVSKLSAGVGNEAGASRESAMFQGKSVNSICLSDAAELKRLGTELSIDAADKKLPSYYATAQSLFSSLLQEDHAIESAKFTLAPGVATNLKALLTVADDYLRVGMTAAGKHDELGVSSVITKVDSLAKSVNPALDAAGLRGCTSM